MPRIIDRKQTQKILMGLGVPEAHLLLYPRKISNFDFSDEDLNEFDLSGDDLSNSSFICTNLRGADLTEAVFDGADLKYANLVGAIGLTGRQLSKAKNLEHAYLDPGRYADAVAAGYRPKEEGGMPIG